MRTFLSTMISVAASVGATTLAVAASAPAVAATIDGAPHAVVRTADLDLHSPAGLRTAMRRIDNATARVCDGNDGDAFRTATCRAKATFDARQSLDRLSASTEVASR